MDGSTFHKERHIKYWLRCLKTFLPSAYTSLDSQRMTLAFFIVTSLDLLDVLHTETTTTERKDYAEWVLRCQHSNGGFRAFTGTMSGDERSHEWDSPNLGGTFFALATLVILGEGMERVKRRECLAWVRKLQRNNGSFGEYIGENGKVEGPEDMRLCYLAAGIRWFLRREEMLRTDDIDVERLVNWIEASVTYEGAFAQAPFHEAHGGVTFNGVGALSLLGRMPDKREPPNNKRMGFEFIERLTKWLVSRQTLNLEEEETLEMVDGGDLDSTPSPKPIPSTFHVQGAFPISATEAIQPEESRLEVPLEDLQWAGFNGRCNKVADTCYAFWIGGTLGILNRVHFQDFNAVRRYLLDKSQHIIGGFGKFPGDLPDVLHSCLGLAALATMREPGLKSIDPRLCISRSARENFERNKTLSSSQMEQ